MKVSIFLVHILFIALGCSDQITNTALKEKTQNRSIIIDTSIIDSIKKEIKVFPNRSYSSFSSPTEVRFFSNGVQSDSIIEAQHFLASWYNINKDTIELVVHVTQFETEALLIRFVNRNPSVFLYRAPHDVGESRNFKINLTDSFSHSIEDAPARFDLKISEVPDSIRKPVVFGYMDMESSGYYDRRDATNRKQTAHMKFYFRTQYREFKY